MLDTEEHYFIHNKIAPKLLKYLNQNEIIEFYNEAKDHLREYPLSVFVNWGDPNVRFYMGNFKGGTKHEIINTDDKNSFEETKIILNDGKSITGVNSKRINKNSNDFNFDKKGRESDIRDRIHKYCDPLIKKGLITYNLFLDGVLCCAHTQV